MPASSHSPALDASSYQPDWDRLYLPQKDLHKEIVDAGFQVVGLSMDSPKEQNSWKVKQRLIKLLGSSKTKTSIQRSHYIFEQGGKLLHSEPKANTTNSFQEALEFIQFPLDQNGSQRRTLKTPSTFLSI
ncbi:hypothetical protein Pst134EA_032754 [Puccinia striiformis f. sp. tritici]|uniref:uncharacterized protein n=1 Tax=Puccinia striiformis f. sp. tritici TaxID=168172 RepID=UPI0020089C05|nr:uncharacterized protein Pst134EA_032754 [Puccinia striiformis f. sp. tritici]KAH9441628.1 hypothetical protein Pst134EA_032754 [Puccinia striiformis f. sp. tritici]